MTVLDLGELAKWFYLNPAVKARPDQRSKPNYPASDVLLGTVPNRLILL